MGIEQSNLIAHQIKILHNGTSKKKTIVHKKR